MVFAAIWTRLGELRRRHLQPGRIAATAAVLLVHAAILLALLAGLTNIAATPSQHEVTFLLPPIAAPPPKEEHPRIFRATNVRTRSTAISPRSMPALPPDLSGLARALSGCAPQDLANLSTEELAKCHAFDRDAASAASRFEFRDRSHSRQSARWVATEAWRNGPLPCVHAQKRATAYGPDGLDFGVDFFCIAGGLLHGFNPHKNK